MAHRAKGKQRAKHQTGGAFEKECRSWLINALKDEANTTNYESAIYDLAQSRPDSDEDENENEVVRQLIRVAAEFTPEDLAGDSEEEDPGQGPSDTRKEDPTPKIAKVLRGMIDTLAHISVPVLDALFFHIINPQKVNKHGYTVVKEILVHKSDLLETSIQSFLQSALQNEDKLDELRLVGNSQVKLYEVLLELHEIIPHTIYPMLTFVAPILSKADDVPSRLNATRFVGTLAASVTSQLPEECPTLWEAYLSRYRDSDKNVRTEYASRAIGILLSQPSLRPPIWQAFPHLLMDVSEEVRIQAVTTVAQVGIKQLDAVNQQLIHVAASRMRDKKLEVRKAAILQLMTLYKAVISRDGCTGGDRDLVATIALALLRGDKMTGKPENDDRERLEKHFVVSIIPHTLDTKRRVKAAIELVARVPQIQLVRDFLARSTMGRRFVLDILDLISNPSASAEERKVKLEKKIELICSNYFPNPIKVFVTFRGFVNLLSVDKRAFELTQELLDNKNQCKKCETQIGEILERAQLKVGDAEPASADSIKVLKSFLVRIAPMQFDASAVEFLAREARLSLREDDHGVALPPSNWCLSALKLLKAVGELYPHHLNNFNVVVDLLALFECGFERISKIGSLLLRVMLEKGVKSTEQEWCPRVVESMKNLIVVGSPRVAKRAFRLLLMTKGRLSTQEFVDELAGRMIEEVKKPFEDPVATARALYLLGQVVTFYPKEYESTMRDLMLDTVIKEIILAPESSPNMESGYEEGSMHQIPISNVMQVKVSAIKWCMRVLVSMCPSSTSKTAEPDRRLGKKVIDLLIGIVQSQGVIGEEYVSPPDACWFRATAGAALIKLCHTNRHARELGAHQLVILANLAMDEVIGVRTHFATRLYKSCLYNMLWLPFVSLFALLVLPEEPDAEKRALIRGLAKNYLVASIKQKQRLLNGDMVQVEERMLPYYVPEYVICYLLYVLSSLGSLQSHVDVPELTRMIEPIAFVLEILKEEKMNFDLVARILADIRESTDPNYEDKKERMVHAKKLWALSDIAIQVITYRLKIVIRDESEKSAIPKRYLTKDSTISRKTVAQSFVPDEIIEYIAQGHGKLTTGKNARVRTTSTSDNTTTKSTRDGTRAARGGKGARRKLQVVEEEEEEEDGDQPNDEHNGNQASTSNTVLSRTRTREAKRRRPSPSLFSDVSSLADDSPKKKKGRVSALAKTNGFDLDVSPIPKSTSGPNRPKRGGFAASTPLAKAIKQPKAVSESEKEEEEKSDEEVEEEKPPQKKKTNGKSEDSKGRKKKEEPKPRGRNAGPGSAHSSPAKKQDVAEKPNPIASTRSSQRTKKPPVVNAPSTTSSYAQPTRASRAKAKRPATSPPPSPKSPAKSKSKAEAGKKPTSKKRK